jgi:membrane-associated phospholipid phosphatase
MDRTKKNFVSYALLLTAQLFLYQIIGYLNQTEFQSSRMLDLALGLDGTVQFRVWAIWWYILYYILLLVPFSFVGNHEVFQRFFRSFLILTVVGDLTHLLIPVTMPPFTESLDPHSFTDLLLQSILNADTRGNCFPSLHCAQSLMIAYWVRFLPPGRKFFSTTIAVMAILVSISTVLIKQHWILDVVGALILVLGVTRFYEFELKYQRV